MRIPRPFPKENVTSMESRYFLSSQNAENRNAVRKIMSQKKLNHQKKPEPSLGSGLPIQSCGHDRKPYLYLITPHYSYWDLLPNLESAQKIIQLLLPLHPLL